MTKTKDGRDLTAAVWRTIPEFPKYEITPDGDVRNRRTGKLLAEHENPVTGAWYYSLRKQLRNGALRNYNRNYTTLIRDAYPEASA